VTALGPFTGYGRRRQTPTEAKQAQRAAIRFEAVGDAPRKHDCPGHAARRDSIGRLPVGDCGESCVMRRYRLGVAVWDGERWL
jgi:hypothetical protein